MAFTHLYRSEKFKKKIFSLFSWWKKFSPLNCDSRMFELTKKKSLRNIREYFSCWKFNRNEEICFIAQMHSLKKSEFDFSRSRTEKNSQNISHHPKVHNVQGLYSLWNHFMHLELNLTKRKKLINFHSTNKIIIISLTSGQETWKKNFPKKKREPDITNMYASNAKAERWTMECVFFFSYSCGKAHILYYNILQLVSVHFNFIFLNLFAQI